MCFFRSWEVSRYPNLSSTVITEIKLVIRPYHQCGRKGLSAVCWIFWSRCVVKVGALLLSWWVLLLVQIHLSYFADHFHLKVVSRCGKQFSECRACVELKLQLRSPSLKEEVEEEWPQWGCESRTTHTIHSRWLTQDSHGLDVRASQVGCSD